VKTIKTETSPGTDASKFLQKGKQGFNASKVEHYHLSSVAPTTLGKELFRLNPMRFKSPAGASIGFATRV
jgi:hypothetical protein